MVACQFQIPTYDYDKSIDPHIWKCDLCNERRKNGKLPACVEICPNEALLFGKRSEIIQIAKNRIKRKPDVYIDHIYGEHEAGGTGWLYLSPVPFDQLGMKMSLEQSSYPALTKGFLYSVPTIFVLVPTLLLGLHKATKNNHLNEHKEDE